MKFRQWWFEVGEELLHLPPDIIDEMMMYNFDWPPRLLQREALLYQFLVNCGHIWNFDAKWHKRLAELIDAGLVNLNGDYYKN